jgi:hypothetical protein
LDERLVAFQEGNMSFTWTQLLIWVLIAGMIGCMGEMIADRRRLSDFFSASSLGLLAIFLLVGILHFHFVGELFILRVPLLSTVLVAALFVSLWSGRGSLR